MQRLFSVRVGEEAVEMHKLDLAVETEQRDRLARGIALSTAKGDHGTRQLLEDILKNEEESIDWLETQLRLIEELGRERYLAEQMHD
jgi:bacterioferritin